MPNVDELDAGDLVWVEFDPVRGREQAGRRPAVVITSAAYHQVSNMAFVCPITTNPGTWPFKVPLPSSLEVQGGVLVDQVRAVDRSRRIFGRLGSLPDETLEAIRGILAAMIRPDT